MGTHKFDGQFLHLIPRIAHSLAGDHLQRQQSHSPGVEVGFDAQLRVFVHECLVKKGLGRQTIRIAGELPVPEKRECDSSFLADGELAHLDPMRRQWSKEPSLTAQRSLTNTLELQIWVCT
jgi:hypothetical protein